MLVYWNINKSYLNIHMKNIWGTNNRVSQLHKIRVTSIPLIRISNNSFGNVPIHYFGTCSWRYYHCHVIRTCVYINVHLWKNQIFKRSLKEALFVSLPLIWNVYRALFDRIASLSIFTSWISDLSLKTGFPAGTQWLTFLFRINCFSSYSFFLELSTSYAW